MILVRRIAQLAAGDGASRIIGLAIAAILARVLGVADFGIFSAAMSLALVVSVAIDFGQNILIGRMVAHDSDRGRDSVVHIVRNKLLFTCVAAVVTPAVATVLGAGTSEVLTVLLLVIWGGGLSVFDTLRAVARSTGNFVLDSTANGLESCLRLAGIVVVWALHGGIAAFALWFAAEAIIAAIVLWFSLDRHAPLRYTGLDAAHSRRLLKEAVPIGMASLGLAGFYRLDQVLVRTLAGAEAAGLYGAAARLALSANVVGMLVMMAAFPDLTRAKDDIALFRRQARRALGTALALGALASLALFIFAKPLVLALYGPAYLDSVVLLRILSCVVVLNSATVVGQQTANALGRESRVATTVLLLAALVVAANFILIPSGGAVAAAWISVVAEAVMALSLLAASADRILNARHTRDND